MHVVRLRFSKGITAPLKTLQELNTQLIGMQCVAVEQAPTRQLKILKFPSFQVLDPTVAQCFAGIKRMSCWRPWWMWQSRMCKWMHGWFGPSWELSAHLANPHVCSSPACIPACHVEDLETSTNGGRQIGEGWKSEGKEEEKEREEGGEVWEWQWRGRSKVETCQKKHGDLQIFVCVIQHVHELNVHGATLKLRHGYYPIKEESEEGLSFWPRSLGNTSFMYMSSCILMFARMKIACILLALLRSTWNMCCYELWDFGNDVIWAVCVWGIGSWKKKCLHWLCPHACPVIQACIFKLYSGARIQQSVDACKH